LSDFETAIWQTFPQDSVVVVGITAVNQNQINQFVTENGITYPILNDEQSGGSGPGGFGGVIYDAYYIPNQGSPYPRDFIVDEEGILAYANNEIDTEYMLYIIDILLAAEDLNTAETNFIPGELILFPAYPNPFNSATTVLFMVRDENFVPLRLNVSDITGRLVKTLVRGTVRPGYHEIPWYASQYASGVYIISLESSLGVQSQKIILMK